MAGTDAGLSPLIDSVPLFHPLTLPNDRRHAGSCMLIVLHAIVHMEHWLVRAGSITVITNDGRVIVVSHSHLLNLPARLL